MTKDQTSPAHVIPFRTDTPPRETRVDDPAIVDAPYEAKSWRAWMLEERAASLIRQKLAWS